MRLKMLRSCNQRVCLLSALQAQHRTPKPPALMRGKNVKAFWLPELFNQSSISVTELEKWLESSGLPEILSDCDCGMKWALCGMAAAANLKCVAKKPFGKLLVVNLGLELAKQAALKKNFKWNRCDGLRIWIGVRWRSDQTSLWWPAE